MNGKDNQKLNVRTCAYDELKPISVMTKEGVALHDNGSTLYIGCFDGDKIVGVVGFQRLGSKMRYKTDYVRPEYRGRGIYSMLFKHRDMICTRMGCKVFTAFCTKMSAATYLRNHFKKKSEKNGIIFVERKF